MSEFCCAEFEKNIKHFEKDPDGSWNIMGCCGGGCYVVSGVKYCPYCGMMQSAVSTSTISQWKGGREAEGTGLENRNTETYRGFESTPLPPTIERVLQCTRTFGNVRRMHSALLCWPIDVLALVGEHLRRTAT